MSQMATPKAKRSLIPRIWVMRVLEDGESETLARHVRAKAAQHIPSLSTRTEDQDALNDPEAFDDWLRFRFTNPLEDDAAAGPDYSKAFNALSILTISAGLASSALAGAMGNAPRLAIAILGLVVGVLAAVNRIWNPAQRSVARYQAAYALRREGWDFVHDRGRYARLPPDLRLGAFIDEIGHIHRAVETVDETAFASGGDTS
jgi:hypothetical protein